MVQRNRKHKGGGISSAQEKQETIRGPIAAGPNPLSCIIDMSVGTETVLGQEISLTAAGRARLSVHSPCHRRLIISLTVAPIIYTAMVPSAGRGLGGRGGGSLPFLLAEIILLYIFFSTN